MKYPFECVTNQPKALEAYVLNPQAGIWSHLSGERDKS